MKLALFNIANFRVDGGAMFGVVPKALWSRTNIPDENNNIVLSLRSLIIQTEGRVILVDAGWGDKQDEKFFRHIWIHDGEGLTGGIARCGYKPEDVTDVLLTHLHADHCGGCFVNKPGGGFEPVFKNAFYHVSRTQWKWANDSNLREEDAYLTENIKPIGDSGRLNLIEENGILYKDITLRICNGHTPGLIVPFIKLRGKTFIYTGDLIPTTSHIPLIWNMSYDLLPLVTIGEKQDVLNEALAEGHILIFQHDPLTECCTLSMTPKGIRASEKKSLADYL